jgi:ornithine cyclodeaminase/alanine dehydrogenase-like protein (mu-crystallin family)
MNRPAGRLRSGGKNRKKPPKRSVSMLALTKHDLRQLVPMRDAISLVKSAFAELSEGRAIVPLRSFIEVTPGKETMFMMPAYLPGMASLGFKMIAIFQDNGARGLPVGNALVCALDPETGVPEAIMSGAYLTALRTGAVSGASTELMAREDARNLVVIGSGVQGVTQAAAVCEVRDIERITIVYRHEESFERFREMVMQDWPHLSDRLTGSGDAESALRDADVVCLATTSRKPVFEADWIRPGTHVSGVGSFTPEMQEAPAEFVARARVVVDMKEHVLQEAGDLIIPLRDGTIAEDHILGELGELVLGRIQARTSPEDVTFFKSVGNAVQDMAVASAALKGAKEKGLGQEIDLE